MIVRDSVTRESIPYVSIRVLNTKLGINFSIGDVYLLKNIPIGKQTIQINTIGYKKVLKTIDILKDELTLINVLLSPEPVMLPSVTKTAERMEEARETNISLQTITQEDLKLIPMTIEKDIFRALKVLPGISTTGDATSKFYVRGGGGDQNLIIFDNMIIFNPYHALGMFSIFNGDAIKASEISTGGFSPEFGGRLSSVINIVTRDGNRNKLSGKLNLGMLSGQAFLEGPIPSGAYYIAYRKSFFDEIVKKFVGKEVPLSFFDISGKVTMDMLATGKASFNFISSKDDIINSKATEPNYHWKSNAFGLNLLTFIEQFFFTTSFSYSNFENSEEAKPEAENINLKSNIENVFFNVKTDYLFKNNDLLSLGLSMLQQNLTFSFLNNSGFLMGDTKTLQDMNLWMKFKFIQIEDFIAEVGVRNNIISLEGKTFYNLEPRVNLKYQLFSDLSIKGSFTRMHQVIISTSNEEDLTPLWEVTVPIVKPFYPERADQVVLGFEAILFNNLNLSIQGYNKKISNYIEYNLEKKSSDDPDFASGSGKSYGVETLLRFNFDQIFGWCAYTWNWSDKTVNGITFPPRYDKRHNLNIILGTRLPFDIDFSLHWEYSSGMPFTPVVGYYDETTYPNIPIDHSYNTYIRRPRIGFINSSRLPPYHKLDVNLSKTLAFGNIPKVNINIDIINIYDHKNIFYINKKTGERVNMLPFLPALSIGVEF